MMLIFNSVSTNHVIQTQTSFVIKVRTLLRLQIYPSMATVMKKVKTKAPIKQPLLYHWVL